MMVIHFCFAFKVEMKMRVIAERDSVVTKLESMDTHEHIALKEEVIKGRDKAIEVCKPSKCSGIIQL